MDGLLERFLRRLIRSGALEVIASSGRRFCVGDGAGKRIRVRFVDAAAEWRLLRDPELALGEIYTDGGLVVEAGDICDVVELGLRNFRNGKDIRWMRFLDRMRTALRRLDQRNDSQRAQKKRRAPLRYRRAAVRVVPGFGPAVFLRLFRTPGPVPR